MENPNSRSKHQHHHRRSLTSSSTSASKSAAATSRRSNSHTASTNSSKGKVEQSNGNNNSSGTATNTTTTSDHRNIGPNPIAGAPSHPNPSTSGSRLQSRPRQSSRAHNFSRPSQNSQPSNPPPPPESPVRQRRTSVVNATPTTPAAAYEANQSHTSVTPFERVNYPSNPRAPSPDTLSRVSTSSSAVAGAPQLRKKSRTLSIKNDLGPTLNAAPESPTNATGQFVKDEQAKLAALQNSANSSKPLSRGESDAGRQHSPVYRRAPASHSSYGVETTCGPPPSYTTQRTISQERIRKPERNTIIWNPPSQGEPTSNSHERPEVESSHATETQPDSATSLVHSSPDTIDSHSISTPTDTDQMANVTIRGQRAYRGESTEEDSKASSSESRRSEDLFLNIAKVNAARAPTSKTEKRKSRISLPFLSASRPTQESRTSPVRSHIEAEPVMSPQHEIPKYYSKRSSLGSHVPGAFSRKYHQDGYRAREQSVEPNSDAELSDNQYARRHSNANADTVRLATRSSQGLRSQKFVSEPMYIEPAKTGETVATESTVSTAAPSTVWDELDDLKTRIRKLELTGKLPPSSAAAMSAADRPRTATTTATSMSMSPKYQPGGVTLTSNMEGISSAVHPLLHEALGNARQVLSNDVFQKLYATASDALQLASMLNGDSQSAVSQSGGTMTERQVRRMTESMCRGLTELAIAMTAECKPTHLAARPVSRESSHPPSAMLRSRRYSNDPSERPLSSRVTSRLESRRTSIHGAQTTNGITSPETRFRESPTALPQLPGIRLNRGSAITRNRRTPGYYDGADDESEVSPSVRPLSRAQTELSAYSQSVRERTPMVVRELADQHPSSARREYNAVPNGTPLSTTASTNFVSRRKYASPGSVVSSTYDNSPVTPREHLAVRDVWGRSAAAMIDDHRTGPVDMSPSAALPEGQHAGRASSTRRTLGFAGRIGSSMGSRLRAARTDRKDSSEDA